MRSNKPPSDGVPSYLGRLTQAPLLSASEEMSLTMAVKEGSHDARQRLAEANLRLVINIARTYHSKTMPLEDLIQEGCIGLMQAIERFDPDKGFRFSTYATHWIRQSIGRAIDNKSKTIRLPAHVSQSIRKLERARQEWLKCYGTEPTQEELCGLVGLTPAKIQALMAAHQDLISLEMRIGENESTTLGSVLRDTQGTSPEQQMIDSELAKELSLILGSLDEQERQILAIRLRGLSAKEEAIAAAEVCQISRERMRTVGAQVVRKLRNAANQKKLKELLD